MAQTRPAPAIDPKHPINLLTDALSLYWTAKKQLADIDAAAEKLSKRLHATFTAIDTAEAKLKKAKTDRDTALVSALLAGNEPADRVALAQQELDAANDREAAIRRQQQALAGERELVERDVAVAQLKLDTARAAVVRPHVEELLARRENYRARILAIEAALAAIQSELPPAMPTFWDSRRHIEPDKTLAGQWRTTLEELTRIPMVKLPTYDESRIRRVERVVLKPDPERFTRSVH